MVSKSEVNEGHYLELLDRLYILTENLHNHCLQHPLAEYDEEIYNLHNKLDKDMSGLINYNKFINDFLKP